MKPVNKIAVSQMLNERGVRSFPIWLLGDSEPTNWANRLDYPLDLRHPAIHNIWTPIISNVQGIFYKKSKIRIDEENIFVRNAIKERKHKPKYKDITWNRSMNAYLNVYKTLITENKPTFIFCFGSFAFEFARRVMSEGDPKNWSYWNTKLLGGEFKKRISEVKYERTNIIPLLHASIARGYFLSGHSKFTGIENGNYFHYTSEKISEALCNDNFLTKICFQ